MPLYNHDASPVAVFRASGTTKNMFRRPILSNTPAIAFKNKSVLVFHFGNERGYVPVLSLRIYHANNPSHCAGFSFGATKIAPCAGRNYLDN